MSGSSFAESTKMESNSLIEDLFEMSLRTSSSSEEPSLLSSIPTPEDSPKIKLYKKGLYSPGSGEICTKYLTMSSSSVLTHQYYNYPSIKYPGILEALFNPEPEKVYDENGQDLYLDLCKEMKIVPVRIFHRDLIGKVVNLRYYGVNSVGIRAMCLALAYNKTVNQFDLTGNFIDRRDACYHLGQLLGYKNALQEVILSGCNIRDEGVRKLVINLHTRNIDVLDLSENNITDCGFTYLANEIQQGAIINRLNLRRNDLTSDSLILLAEVMEYNNNIKYLDLSWNKFMEQSGPTKLFNVLGDSEVLVELNLAWTSLALTSELTRLFGIATLRVLDLSNNKLPSLAARVIARSLKLAATLEILNLSCNPFTPGDALSILLIMKQEKVKLKELYMNHIAVSKEFAAEFKDIMQLEFRRDAIITHGDVLRNYSIEDYNIKIIIVRRLVRNTQGKRRNKLDILAYFMEQQKTEKFLDPYLLKRTLKLYDVAVKEEFIQDLVHVFPGPKLDSGKRSINLDILVDYIHRIWPHKKLPPTPPPTPPPMPKKEPKKKGKGKKVKQ